MREWFHRRQMYLTVDASSVHGADTSDQVIESQVRVHEARNLVQSSGETLATALVERDLDATGVLKVIHFVAGGGGPERVGGIWPDVKSSLQAIALQQQPAGKSNAAKGRSPRSRLTAKDHKERQAIISQFIRDQLEKGVHPERITLQKINEATGFSEGYISQRSQAWHALVKGRGEQRRPAPQKEELTPLDELIEREEHGGWDLAESEED